MKKKWLIPIGIVVVLLLLSTKKAFAQVVPSMRIRGCDPDSLGCGSFGASRTGHKHQGIDLVVAKGQPVYSPIYGTVTRFPFPYGDDLRYTGVEIKNAGHSIKLFYISPTVIAGDIVNAGEQIGTAQDIAAKYSPKMTNHVHLEVRDATGKILDPTNLF